MKKINNMSDLEKKAIKVINGMLVVWPQSNKTERLEIMGMVPDAQWLLCSEQRNGMLDEPR